MRNTLFWSNHIRASFIPEIDALFKCVEQRLLPSFDNVEAEADQFAQDEYQKLGESIILDLDGGDLAERAQDAALSYWQTLDDVRKALINMFAAAIYHLLEQQLLLILRQEFLDFSERENSKFFELKELKKRLLSDGIDFAHFTAWSKIEELRLVANVTKHGDGKSASDLRVLRPDFFPYDSETFQLPVYLPLMGQDFTISKDELQKYANSVRDFLNELSTAFENLP